MKTIGVIGGLGPQATMDFEARLHRVAQQHIPQKGNMGYPPLFVYYCRFPPVVIDEERMTPVTPLTPNPPFLEAVARVSKMADFVVITANGPHIFLDAITEASNCPVLSMIEVVLAALAEKSWGMVGLLRLGQPRVYMEPLEVRGIPFVTLMAELQEQLNRSIFRVQQGEDEDVDRQVVEKAIDAMRREGADGVILGCTELPVLLGDAADADHLLNPTQLLAEAAVARALEDDASA